MPKAERAVLVASAMAFALLIATASVSAQAPQPNANAAAPVQGDIVRVDADAKVLAVRTAEGTEVEFQYSEATEISGAKDGAAGLATMKEGRVTVHYTEDGQSKAKKATKIVIEPRQ